MSAIQANWHVAALDGDGEDPFGIRPRVETVGKPIPLDGEPRLVERFEALIDREGQLFNAGVICAIKDDQQACCSACPLRHVDPLDEMSSLCEVGIEQESVLTRLRILSHAPGEAQAT